MQQYKPKNLKVGKMFSMDGLITEWLILRTFIVVNLSTKIVIGLTFKGERLSQRPKENL